MLQVGTVLKPGDEIVVESGAGSREYHLTTVKRVTPTGQIVVAYYDMRFDTQGREVGSSGLNRRYLTLPTPEIRMQIIRRKIAYLDWKKIDDEKMRQVAGILGLWNSEPGVADD